MGKFYDYEFDNLDFKNNWKIKFIKIEKKYLFNFVLVKEVVCVICKIFLRKF